MHVFTYGTLMDPGVWLRVAGRPHPAEPASLAHYQARALRGFHFPGLIEAPGAITPGQLYRDVPPEILARLDAYEDDFYIRTTVTVETTAGEPVSAQVYLMAPSQRSHVLEAVWTAEG